MGLSEVLGELCHGWKILGTDMADFPFQIFSIGYQVLSCFRVFFCALAWMGLSEVLGELCYGRKILGTDAADFNFQNFSICDRVLRCFRVFFCVLA